MGLAASQARLLSLTARQHTVEGRAQYLQAQKLRLANESDRVYENYVNALDATSLQTKTYDSKGKVHWVEGSLNNLMRYDADDKSLGNVYYVQDINDGKLYMPQTITNAYDKSGNDLFNFLDELHVKYEKNVHQDEYIDAQNVIADYENRGYNILPTTQENITKYNSLLNNVNNPPKSSEYDNANELYNLISFSESTTRKGVYIPSDEYKYNMMLNQLGNIKKTSYYTGDNKKLIDSIEAFNVSEIFNKTDKTSNILATTTDNTSYIYWNKAKENEKEDEDKQKIDDLMKFKMLLNGGKYERTDHWEKNSFKTNIDNYYNNKSPIKDDQYYLGALLEKDTDAKVSGNIYSDETQQFLDSYTGLTNSNYAEAILKMATQIKDTEFNKSQAEAQSEFDKFLTSIGKTKSEIETGLNNYNSYIKAVSDLNTKDQTTYTKYENTNLGPYYEQIFSAIQSAGGCKEISTENAKSGSWVNNMVKNAQVVLATFDNNKNELDSITASSNVGLREITNDKEITKADSKYEAEMDAINSKETKYNTQLNQLESERNAIKTEIESLKQIREDNISSTFKLFT